MQVAEQVLLLHFNTISRHHLIFIDASLWKTRKGFNNLDISPTQVQIYLTFSICHPQRDSQQQLLLPLLLLLLPSMPTQASQATQGWKEGYHHQVAQPRLGPELHGLTPILLLVPAVPMLRLSLTGRIRYRHPEQVFSGRPSFPRVSRAQPTAGVIWVL